MTQLTEKYRPASFAEVVGQDKVVKTLIGLQSRGALAKRAYFISGLTGTGKTTLARIIAASVASKLATTEMDAADVGLDDIRRMEDRWHSTALAKPGEPTGRAWIFNEVHRFSGKVVSRLLTALEAENIPSHVAVCLTTTVEGQGMLFDGAMDAHPLLHRCCVLNLAQRDLAEPFARLGLTIARAEGLDGRSIEDYIKLARKCKNSMRAILQAIDAGEMLP